MAAPDQHPLADALRQYDSEGGRHRLDVGPNSPANAASQRDDLFVVYAQVLSKGTVDVDAVPPGATPWDGGNRRAQQFAGRRVTQGHYVTGQLVPEYHRVGAGKFSVSHLNIGSADACGMHPDQHLVLRRGGDGAFEYPNPSVPTHQSGHCVISHTFL